MSVCIIRQPAGLGDILFCQKLAAAINKRYKKIWPVIPEFLWLNDYLEGDIQYVDVNSEFEFKEEYNAAKPWHKTSSSNYETHFIYNLQDSDSRMPNISVMEAKYVANNRTNDALSFTGWRDYVKIKRDRRKEQELCTYLDIKPIDKFTLVNRWYGSPPNSVKCSNMEGVQVGGRIVEMTNIEGYNLFDWIGVIEQASAIYTVDTAINYIIELIPTTSDLHLFSRFTPPNFFHIQRLFKKPWIYYK